MWRALFFAIGTLFILLGLQCLVVDQFNVTRDGKLSKVMLKVIDVIDPPAGAGLNLADPASQNQAFSMPATGGSAFGPSRFQSPYSQFSTDSGNSADGSGSAFGLAGYSSAAAKSPKKPRAIRTKDWMPWSLLAIGTIIVLYTKSTAGLIVTSSSHE